MALNLLPYAVHIHTHKLAKVLLPGRLNLLRDISVKSKESVQVSKMLKMGSTVPPAPVQSRPKITLDKRKFQIKQRVQGGKDQGRNCVSVILKSSSSTSKESKLSERIQILKDLSSKYPLKIEGRSQNSRRAEARLDFCFHSAKDARLFFVKVNDLFRAGACRKISVFMFAEESLGRFNIPPVLCC